MTSLACSPHAISRQVERPSRGLALLFAVALYLLLPTSLAAAECQFVLGFKTLRDLIGHEIVGECLENEHHNEFGDSVQQTTGGLLVWRKADNWTAFTDGFRSWVNGPFGLQERLNTQRFDWEGDRSPVTSVVPSTRAPTPEPPPTRSLRELTEASTWYQDGIDYSDKYQVERIALRALLAIDRNNPELAEAISSWSWVFDEDMNISEAYAIRALSNIDENLSDFTRHLTSLPWIQDGIDYREVGAVISLSAVTFNHDPDFAFEFARLPWIVDGVTFLESDSMLWLASFSGPPQRLRFSVAEMRQVLRFVRYPPTEVDFYLLNALSILQHRTSYSIGRVLALPWIADGLDEAERIFLIAATGSDYNEDQLSEPYYIASAAITLPRGGVVNLWIVRNRPFQPGHRDLQHLEAAVRSSEQFWDLPFPVDHVILSLLTPGTRGGHLGHMMVLHTPVGNLSDALQHEVAHYYFKAGPRWYTEGGADLVRSYAWSGGEIPIVDFPEYCRMQGVHNLQALIEYTNKVAGSPWDWCSYSMGHHFLVALHETMGTEAWRSALRAFYLSVGYRGLYLSAWTGQPEDEDIYSMFLEHTPPHLVNAVKDVFRRLHGGPFVD